MTAKRKRKASMPHPDSGKQARLLVAGVPVTVILGDDGCPRSAGALLRGDSPEEARLAWLAASLAMQSGENGARASSGRERTRRSAQARTEKAKPAYEWLRRAHEADPSLGAKHLAAAAMKLAKDPPPGKGWEPAGDDTLKMITLSRAKQLKAGLANTVHDDNV